ncbi:hypothetical protein [Hungatella sp.]|uniref:hypothetical protein n=1 Tax=Hungatella sp. TaxID=2613924 RepID=UPI0039952A17
MDAYRKMQKTAMEKRAPLVAVARAIHSGRDSEGRGESGEKVADAGTAMTGSIPLHCKRRGKEWT